MQRWRVLIRAVTAILLGKSGRGKGREHGFALIVALWASAMVAALALNFVRSAQIYTRQAFYLLESARAEAVADAGINLALQDMLGGAGGSERFKRDGALVGCRYAHEGTLLIRAQDAGGLVNLNLADAELIKALMSGLGVETDEATRLADSIIDFRDPDDVRRPFGAEAPEYLAAGLARGPKNAPFDDLAELGQVLGLDEALITRVQPHVTLYSTAAGIDPRVMRPETSAVLGRGFGQTSGATDDFSQDAIPRQFAVASDGAVWALRAEARLPSGVAFVRTAVVELNRARAGAYRFRSWRRGSSTTTDAIRASVESNTPC